MGTMKAQRRPCGGETSVASRQLASGNIALRGFEVVESVATLLTRFAKPWYIAGGWALDLFLGHLTREHHDIDVAVFREDQSELRKFLAGWRFQKVVKRKRLGREAWDRREWLSLPVHEVHASSPAKDMELEILLNESSGEHWVFRRNPKVTLARSSLGRLAHARVPYLTPEVVLLYKADHPSEVDEADFAIVGRALNSNQRRWLADALRVCYPGHRWLSALSLEKRGRQASSPGGRVGRR
jgi:hypothetical protein